MEIYSGEEKCRDDLLKCGENGTINCEVCDGCKMGRLGMRRRKVLKTAIFICLLVGIIGVIGIFGINAYVKRTVSYKINSVEEVAGLEQIDCILVLGCQVKENGTPSLMLRDRLNKGVELYYADVAPKLLMSGDHGSRQYDEVGTMKQYAVDSGIASEDIFMDHAGFSTYESLCRAKEVFGAKRIVIVTQEYHLYRALYIAEGLGLEAYGVAADGQTYAGQSMRDFREILARVKDFGTTMLKPEPTYLGEVISISGNGDLTND